MTDEQREDLRQAIQAGSWPDGRPVTMDDMARLDGCCQYCWPKANQELEAGVPFRAILHKVNEKKLKKGEVRVNRAMWGFERIVTHKMCLPFDDEETAVLMIEIEYCPFCGRRLGEDT